MTEIEYADAPLKRHPAEGLVHQSRRPLRVSLEIRQFVPLWRRVLLLSAGLAVGFGLATLVLVMAGVGVGDLANEFVVSIFSSPENVSSVLSQAAPLLIAGLSAAVAFRIRFWNIGIEGQMIIGSTAATAVALGDWGGEPLRIWLMMLAAAIGGALWILPPLLLRVRLGINEVICTLLLNYVAFNILLYLLYGDWKDPTTGFPNSEQYEATERLSLLGWHNLSYALPFSLLLALLCWWLNDVSRLGYFMRLIHANPRMALAVGVPVVPVTIGVALLSGSLSGLAGFAISAASEFRLTQNFFIGYGFSGILIAFLAKNNPLIAIIVSFCVSILFVASQSLQVFYQIPLSVVQLIQALIVMCVAATEFLVRFRIHICR